MLMALSDLEAREGWRVHDVAARVHYRGDGDRFSVEYYDESECVVYWRVLAGRDTAVPVPRDDVPAPLRIRVRDDLEAAGIDPAVERATV